MKINSFNNIPFQKTLAAKCSIIKDEKPCECCIYELEDNEKKSYISNMQDDGNWKNSWFLPFASFDGKSQMHMSDLYVLEDDGECIGFAETNDFDGVKILNILEVSPQCAKNRNPQRHISYIGQSLMAFLAAKSKEENMEALSVSQPVITSLNFYKNCCGFRWGEAKYGLCLKQQDYDTLIDKNEEKTGKRVELIG